MQNPYQSPSRVSSQRASLESRVALKAILISPVVAFLISLFLGAMAGIFIVFLAAPLSDANGDPTLLFDAIFLPTFVWLPYVVCGYIAGRMAGFRHVFHALCAGLLYLGATVAMSLPWDSGHPYFWTHLISFSLVVPLALIGGKLSERW